MKDDVKGIVQNGQVQMIFRTLTSQTTTDGAGRPCCKGENMTLSQVPRRGKIIKCSFRYTKVLEQYPKDVACHATRRPTLMQTSPSHAKASQVEIGKKTNGKYYQVGMPSILFAPRT